MKFFKRKHDVFTIPKKGLTCPHRKRKNFVIWVKGTKCKFRSSPLCPSCTEEYLNKYSTICAKCGKPIFPGTPVAVASWEGALYPYTHMTFDCGEPAAYCGTWGEGKLIGL